MLAQSHSVRRRSSGLPSRRGARPRVRATREIRRLTRHFRSVVRELRARDVSHLDERRREARRALIERLEIYGRAGRFPRNLDFSDRRMPYFVDAAGTRCAVAHLVESTGEGDLMWRVARTANNAFIRELAGDADLERWASTMGFTMQELGRIQPSYEDFCATTADTCLCYAATGTVVEAKVTSIKNGNQPTFEVTAVHGDPSLATVGQSFEENGSYDLDVGDRVIAGVYGFSTGSSMSGADVGLGNALRIDGDTVTPTCEFGATGPDLTTSQAIDALTSADVLTSGDGCKAYLIKLDSDWAGETCGSSSCGCSVVGAPSSPFLFVASAIALAAWTRRRMRARRRRAARELAQRGRGERAASDR